MNSPISPPPRHFRRLTLVDGDIKAWTTSQVLTSPTATKRIGAQRRQGSISYTSTPSTPYNVETTTPDIPGLTRRNSLSTVDKGSSNNSSPGKRRPRPLSLAISNDQRQTAEIPSPPLTLAETYAPLLRFIAQKESKCLELRSQLAQHESELAILKRKWEKVVSRERAYGYRAGSLSTTFDYPKPRSTSNSSTGSSSAASRSSLESSLLASSPDSSFDGGSVPSSPSPSPCSPSAPLTSVITTQRPSASPLSSLFTPLSNFTNINIDHAVDKILNPSMQGIPSALANVNLSNAMDKIISPKQQKRASRVLEGVISWSTAALNANNNSNADTFRPPSPPLPDDAVTSSPSAYLTPSSLSTSPPIREEGEEPEKNGPPENEEEGWGW